MIKLSFQFFSFVILFNLLVTICLLWEAVDFVERYGAAVLVLFFWFKVCGVILSLIAECVFSFKKKVIFLQNIGFAPIKMLKNIYLVDFVIYLLLCIVIVVYI